MAINFPNNPNINDTHVSSGQSWKWDGSTWKSGGNTGEIGIAGISTTGTSIFNHINASGIVTASQFVGDGSGLSGIDPTALKDAGGNIKVQANPSGVVFTGIITGNGSGLTNLPSSPGSATIGGSTFTAVAGRTEQLDSISNTNLIADYDLYFSHSLGKQSQKVSLLNDGVNSPDSYHIQQSGITFNNHILVSVGSSVVGGNLTINATPETGITGTITYKFFRTEVS